MRTTIYLNKLTITEDNNVFRAFISDGRGQEIEVIACPPKFVSALKEAQTFWEDFQLRRARADAEERIANLPKTVKRGA